MKHHLRLSGTGTVLILFMLIGVLSGVAFADTITDVTAVETEEAQVVELSPTIHLDLSRPSPAQEDGEDPFNEKYEEVMRDLSISEEAAMVVDHIKDAIEHVNDVSMEVAITEIRGQRIEEIFLRLYASVGEKLARVEFLQPSALRGQLLVLDQDKMEMRMFQPVNNQILVQGLEDASKEALSALSVAELTSFLDFTQYSVEVLNTWNNEDVISYLLQVEALDNQIWHVSVAGDTWVPHEISIYEQDALVGTMSLSNVELDPGLSVESLTDLPDVKETRL